MTSSASSLPMVLSSSSKKGTQNGRSSPTMRSSSTLPSHSIQRKRGLTNLLLPNRTFVFFSQSSNGSEGNVRRRTRFLVINAPVVEVLIIVVGQEHAVIGDRNFD